MLGLAKKPVLSKSRKMDAYQDDSDDDDFYDRTSSRAKVPSLLRFAANKSDNACSQAMHAS